MFNTGERLLCKSRHGKLILVNVTRNNKLNVINLEEKKGSVIVGREAFYLSASAPIFTYSCSQATGNTVSLMLASEEQFSFHPRSDYQQGYNTISITLLSLKKCIILFAFAKSALKDMKLFKQRWSAGETIGYYLTCTACKPSSHLQFVSVYYL